MKKLFIFLFMLPLWLFAQKTTYTTHTVGAKESLSSIGRAYNINPRTLAKLNNIAYEKGLTIGQVLKVPSAGGAVTAPVNTAVAEVRTAPVKAVVAGTGNPVYHTVAKKETLYHISTLYKNASVADIKKWNHLTTDGLTEGARIIVGYDHSSATQVISAVAPDEPVVKAAETKVVVKQTPVVIYDKGNMPDTKSHDATPDAGANFNGGFFKSQYSKAPGKAEETGTAGIFKSTSGWEDGKYYCLHNGALAGSIIKITNNANNRSVYAKVLDIMPDLKQNNDLVLRISNAAADELGAGSASFTCTISF